MFSTGLEKNLEEITKIEHEGYNFYNARNIITVTVRDNIRHAGLLRQFEPLCKHQAIVCTHTVYAH